MTSNTPPWWTSDMPESVQRREGMAGVERWQTVYVRYKSQAEAQVSPAGWDLQTSQRLHDATALTEQQPFLSEDHPLYSGFAPTHVNLRIIESPAEFAAPVKQDRRLTPNFKVRVEVQYRTRVSFPLTLKAYIITQHEKDALQDWVPDDYLETDFPQRKPVTELKGTTCITHHFEANLAGSLASSKANGMSGSSLMSTISTGFNFPGAGGGGGGNQQGSLFSQFAGGPGPGPGHRGFQDFPPLFQEGGNNNMGSFRPSEMAKADSLGLNPALYNSLWPEQEAPQLFEQLFAGGGPDGRKGNGDGLSAAAAAAMNSMKQEQQGLFGSGPMAAHQQGLDGHLVQDFEFSNVEFLKPTRMNKVYIVFACNILDQDLLWVVYNIPTVGICRAEQRAKACQKLGITLPDASGANDAQQVPALLDASNNVLQQSKALHRKRAQLQDPFEDLGNVHKAFETGELDAMTLDAIASGGLGGPLGGGQQGSGPAHRQQHIGHGHGHGSSQGQGLPRSRMALRELILEQYESTGLTRKLTALDLQALESHAGFPIDVSSDHANISPMQWDEFQGQFQAVLLLLRTVAGLWNQEDPCIIAGFDMDRSGTVQALHKEPAGTFIVRFSLSQPGSLVLTCKVPYGNPNADSDGLVHAIIQIEDLHHKRVDTWVRDFPGATHALDVYKQKRVDKRKVFHANYTRLRTMEAVGNGE